MVCLFFLDETLDRYFGKLLGKLSYCRLACCLTVGLVGYSQVNYTARQPR